MKSKNYSFKEMNLFERVIAVSAITLLIIVCVSIIIGSIFFGIAGFLKLFGVRYESFSSLLLFVLLYFIIGFILDLIAMVFIRVATQNITGKTKLFLTRMIIDCTFSWVAFHVADEIISGISIQLTTEIIAVLFFHLVGMAFEEKEKKEQGE
ncbi:YrvL family regulatory protein [Heyndrickxia camelliae]|nr:YrvL family regulatory protein [Heyndrickxia camelliae]